MPLKIKPFCSMCGKEPTAEFNIFEVGELTAENIKRRLEAQNWIVEINGFNLDTYCSKKCAE